MKDWWTHVDTVEFFDEGRQKWMKVTAKYAKTKLTDDEWRRLVNGEEIVTENELRYRDGGERWRIA